MLNPVMSGRWVPDTRFGLRLDLWLIFIGSLVSMGLVLILLIVNLYIHCWFWDRELRYRAWRWRLEISTSSKS